MISSLVLVFLNRQILYSDSPCCKVLSIFSLLPLCFYHIVMQLYKVAFHVFRFIHSFSLYYRFLQLLHELLYILSSFFRIPGKKYFYVWDETEKCYIGRIICFTMYSGPKTSLSHALIKRSKMFKALFVFPWKVLIYPLKFDLVGVICCNIVSICFIARIIRSFLVRWSGYSIILA